MKKFAYVNANVVVRYMFNIVLLNIAQGRLHTGATGEEYGNPSLIEGKSLNYSETPWEETFESPDSDTNFLSEFMDRMFRLQSNEEGHDYVFVENEEGKGGMFYVVTNDGADWRFIGKTTHGWFTKELDDAVFFLKTQKKNELSTPWTNTRYFAIVCEVEDLRVLKGSIYDNEETKFRCQMETGSMCWSDSYLKTYKTLKELLPE